MYKSQGRYNQGAATQLGRYTTRELSLGVATPWYNKEAVYQACHIGVLKPQTTKSGIF